MAEKSPIQRVAPRSMVVLDADCQLVAFEFQPDTGMELTLRIRQGWFRKADAVAMVACAPPEQPQVPDLGLRLIWLGAE
jgi:hypothetical protein